MSFHYSNQNTCAFVLPANVHPQGSFPSPFHWNVSPCPFSTPASSVGHPLACGVAAAARVARVELRSRLGSLLLTWTHLTVPNAHSPVRGEGVHSLAPSLFLSPRVLVFALLLCPHQYTFSSSFCPHCLRSTPLLSVLLQAPLCSIPAALHAFSITSLPGPVAPLHSLAPRLFPSCQHLHQRTCESTLILYFLNTI